MFGRLQPILGATEAAFERIFKAPRSERAQERDRVIGDLIGMVEQLERSGIDLDPDDDLMPDPHAPSPPVTLEDLRAALVEDLGVALDRPGRPATFNPERVSRDPERWCALATYGHPLFEATLERVGGPLESGPRGAVAFAEAEGLWSVYRSDRTPPSPVRTLDDLADLGEATSAGEAAEKAAIAARQAAEQRETRLRQAERQSRERWLTGLRARYITLVREAVGATGALHARNGDGVVEPRLVWLELSANRTTAWRNADAFRQHLGLDLRNVLPAAPTTDDPRSDTALTAVVSESARTLNQLVKEWKATQET